MFTGIIESLGKVSQLQSGELSVEVLGPSKFQDVKLGESVAINGVCLTVTEIHQSHAQLKFFVSEETLSRSNLKSMKLGDILNLERALMLSDRLSGHIVQGHVDGLAQLVSIKPVREAYEIQVRLPQSLSKYVVEKGSITLDGISLTVNSVANSDIYLMIIPHTWQNTNLSHKQVGQDLNVEADVIAKYVERLSSNYA